MAKCSHPECELDGEFPAPKDPRNLAARQYFCQAHIKEFNKRWNGLNGFDQEEIFSMQHGAATWNRPTWKMGVHTPADYNNTFKTADDLYRFFKQRRVDEAKVIQPPTPRELPPDVMEACRIFAVAEPVGGKRLKRRYLDLVKKHHPDVSQEDTAAETIKKINVAYRILEDFDRNGQAHA
jgi:hypothetical protein